MQKEDIERYLAALGQELQNWDAQQPIRYFVSDYISIHALRLKR